MQLGLLDQVLTWVALVVEPPAALLVDHRPRRPLLAFGAAAIGVAVLVLAAAPSYGVLLLGFGLYGVGSGPLAHTADVVIVEVAGGAPEQAYGRATFLDTVGALLSPLALAAAAACGVSWRYVLAAFAMWALAYAWMLARTQFPGPVNAAPAEAGLVRHMVRGLRDVMAHDEGRRWLVFLLLFDVLESPGFLRYVWLSEHVGLPPAWVAAYAGCEQVVDLVALAWLDRWLERHDSRPVLVVACLALAVLYPAWLLAPGLAGAIAIGVPLAFAQTMLWPIGKARSLTAVPGRAGAMSAVTTLFGVLPLALIVGAVAEAAGIAAAIVAVTVPSAVALALVAWSARTSRPTVDP